MSVHGATERTSSIYTATLQDEVLVPLKLTDIVSLTLTLRDIETETVINGRNAQDALNANDVTIHATSGLLTWHMQPADNQIVESRADYELHRAVFDCVYNVSQRVVHAIYVLVENISGVTV